MPRENAEAKARRYLAEGRLTVTLATPRRVEARCRGSLGEEYRLDFTPGTVHCDCPARGGKCCHLLALGLVTVRPRGATDGTR